MPAAPIVASHLHDLIVGHGQRGAMFIVVGIIVAVLSRAARYWIIQRWVAVAVVILGLSVTGFGGYQVAEAFAMRHNHRCHNHFGGCGDDDGRPHWLTHDHWFGATTASRHRGPPPVVSP